MSQNGVVDCYYICKEIIRDAIIFYYERRCLMNYEGMIVFIICVLYIALSTLEWHVMEREAEKEIGKSGQSFL